MADGKQRLIEEAKAELGRLLEERVHEDRMTLDEIEAVVEKTMREVAGWVEERLIREQEPERKNRADCPRCGAACPYKCDLDANVLTIHGRRTIPRRYHHCAACRFGFAPIDAVLGLEEGRDATRQVRAWQAQFGSEAAFGATPQLFRELRGIEISASTVERTTVEVGQRLREAALPELGPPEEPAAKPERYYLSMDGTMCPLRDPWKRDGSAGRLNCRYGEAKLGIVFQTQQKEGLDTGVVRRGCVGTLADLDGFLPLLLALAQRWRLGTAGELIALGDGALWIWSLVAKYFPQAVQILDFWHLTEHLWTVARERYGSGTAEAAAWVKQAQWDLKHDLTHSFLLQLREWQPASAEASEVRRTELAFFTANEARMRYGTFLERGYMIGSGVMESGCRQLVGKRLDQAGMHWRPETADAVLAIRAHLRSTDATPLSQYA